MNANELRHIISEHLLQIEDESFLKAINTIVESKISEGIYKLSEYEKERIYMAREELKNGQTISHNDVQKEINQKLEFAYDWEGGLKELKETSVKLQHKINKWR